MLRKIRMTFHFVDNDIIKKILTSMIKPKMEYAEVIWSPYKKKHKLIGKNTRNSYQDGTRTKISIL